MMNKKIIITISLVLLIAFSFTSVAFAGNDFSKQQATQSINNAVKYLQSIQNEDGGFPSRPGRPSSRGLTCWVVMALNAAGGNVEGSDWAQSGNNPIDYLNNCEGSLEETIDYARLLLALSASGKGAIYDGGNLAEKIASFQQSNGQFGQVDQNEQGMINTHMWSILSLVSAEYEIPHKENAKKWLINKQNEDGGFGWLEGLESDVDDTAVAIQTLILLGEDSATSTAIKNALSYIKDYQEKSGGFSAGEWMGNNSNSASDAWVLQALWAAGENPVSDKWSVNGKNAVTHLLGLQSNDGYFYWKPEVDSSKVQMTAYAILALAQKPHPVNIDYEKINSLKVAFSDLPVTHWAFEPIMNLVEAKVLGGYPDGTFQPDKTVTRAEFAKFLVCGLDLEESNNFSLKFNDVSQKNWARNYISTAVNKGYVKGRSDEVFDPNGKIKGSELATMLVRGLPDAKEIPEGKDWYSGYVQLAQENGLLYSNFQPKQSATRAQCTYSIVQLRKILAQD